MLSSINRGLLSRIGAPSTQSLQAAAAYYSQPNVAMKSSIIAFDTVPGTRTLTIPPFVSRIRAFVVGGGCGGTFNGVPGPGGGYAEVYLDVQPGQVFSYTVGDHGVGGSSPATVPTGGGTSSFAGLISATGGSLPGGTPTGGTGTGPGVNTTGAAPTTSGSAPGGSSGHRFGNGQINTSITGVGSSWMGAQAGIDGFGLGIALSAVANSTNVLGTYGSGSYGANSGGIGGGGGAVSNTPGAGGIGGGGGSGSSGSGSYGGDGGNGAVGVEVVG